MLWGAFYQMFARARQQGLEAGSEQEVAFEEAKSALYFINKQKTYTQLYKNYLDAQAAYEFMEPKMKAQHQKTHVDE